MLHSHLPTEQMMQRFLPNHRPICPFPAGDDVGPIFNLGLEVDVEHGMAYVGEREPLPSIRQREI